MVTCSRMPYSSPVILSALWVATNKATAFGTVASRSLAQTSQLNTYWQITVTANSCVLYFFHWICTLWVTELYGMWIVPQ